MPRVDITMSDDEVADFLGSCTQMVVGAIGADGWPTGSIVESRYDDGVLSVALGADPVADDIAREGHLCLVADDHPSYYEIRGVIVQGRVGSDDGTWTDVDVDRTISFDFGRLR